MRRGCPTVKRVSIGRCTRVYTPGRHIYTRLYGIYTPGRHIYRIIPTMCTREACWVVYPSLCAPGRHAGWYTPYVHQGGMLGVVYAPYVHQGGMLGVLFLLIYPGRHAGCIIPYYVHQGGMLGVVNLPMCTREACWVLITPLCAPGRHAGC